MTHDDLVKRAGKWLLGGARIPCSYSGGGFRKLSRAKVVFTEMVTAGSETPDAIGFYNSGGLSVLVECKVSRGDFRADAKKLFRHHPYMGMGDYRYFMTPPGLVKVEELPQHWGLLECHPRSVAVSQLAERQEKAVRREVNVLWSAVRRLKEGESVD